MALKKICMNMVKTSVKQKQKQQSDRMVSNEAQYKQNVGINVNKYAVSTETTV